MILNASVNRAKPHWTVLTWTTFCRHAGTAWFSSLCWCEHVQWEKLQLLCECTWKVMLKICQLQLPSSLDLWPTIEKAWLLAHFINQNIPYTGKLSREKSFANWWNSWRKLASTTNYVWVWPPILHRKLAKTSKFAKVFSLKSFPLYGTECAHSVNAGQLSFSAGVGVVLIINVNGVLVLKQKAATQQLTWQLPMIHTLL